jgi:hypothetical protein
VIGVLQQFAEELISRKVALFLHPSWQPNMGRLRSRKTVDQLFRETL